MISYEEHKDILNLSELTNDELKEQLYKEVLYYTEDLKTLCKIMVKQLPCKMIYRLISKLYRIRIQS